MKEEIDYKEKLGKLVSHLMEKERTIDVACQITDYKRLYDDAGYLTKSAMNKDEFVYRELANEYNITIPPSSSS